MICLCFTTLYCIYISLTVFLSGSPLKSYFNILQLPQNKAMRALTKQRSSDGITPIYRRSQVLKINDLYKLETAKYMH